MLLTGKKVVITGGTRGIGRALVARLLDHGAQVIAVGKSRVRLDTLEQQLDVQTLLADLSRPGAGAALAQEVGRRHPDLDILINNAAVQREIQLLAPPASPELAEEIAINLAAPIALTVGLLPNLIARPEAAVVNVGSALALAPKRASPVYCATKAGLHSFSQALRTQLQGTSVRVLEVFPPVVDTDMTAHRTAPDKIDPADVARAAHSGLESGREEVWIAKARFLPALARFAPALLRRVLDRN